MKRKSFIQKSRKNEKAENSGTAEKERKKGGKAEIFRKKRKRWQPWDRCSRITHARNHDFLNFQVKYADTCKNFICVFL